MINPTKGKLLYKNKDISKVVSEYRQDCSFCPTFNTLNNNYTIKKSLLYHAFFYGMSKDEAVKNVQKIVKQFDLKNYLDLYPRQLSFGYQKRVMIARSLIHKPNILLLDEPTVGLDPAIRLDLINFIKELKQYGITIIVSTHYPDEVMGFSNRVCVLKRGKLVFFDTVLKLEKKYPNLDIIFEE